MDDLESWLSARLDALEQRMTGRIDDLCEKVDDMRVRLSQVEELAMKTHISRAKVRLHDSRECFFSSITAACSSTTHGEKTLSKCHFPTVRLRGIAKSTVRITPESVRFHWYDV